MKQNIALVVVFFVLLVVLVILGTFQPLIAAVLLLLLFLSNLTYSIIKRKKQKQQNKESMSPQSIIAPVWESVDIDGDYESYQSDLSKFTTEQKHIFAIQWYVAETWNGGHYQFLTNSTGIVWKDAIEGLHAIGADDMAINLQKACDRLGPAISFNREEREKVVDALDYDFKDEDDKFYQYADDLESLEMDYIKVHAQAFGIDSFNSPKANSTSL